MQKHKIITSSLAIAFLIFGSTMHGMEDDKKDSSSEVAEQQLSTARLMQLINEKLAYLDSLKDSERLNEMEIICLQKQMIERLQAKNKSLKSELEQWDIKPALGPNNPYNL